MDIETIRHIPILTTIVSAIFSFILFRRYLVRKTGPHLLWWAFGVFCYGAGTFYESTITLMGNSVALTKGWYITGAILGGWPLAQGSVYLLNNKKLAHILSAITIPFIIVCSILVILSPVNMEALEPNRPSGAILGWQWVRLLTPFINLYAVAFLIGGAFRSGFRYWQHTEVGAGHRTVGNFLIAFGAILPGIGGTAAKAGYVEALYIGEFIGLLFIWAGFEVMARAPYMKSIHAAQVAAVPANAE